MYEKAAQLYNNTMMMCGTKAVGFGLMGMQNVIRRNRIEQ